MRLNYIVIFFLISTSINAKGESLRTDELYTWCEQYEKNIIQKQLTKPNLTLDEVYNTALCDGFFEGMTSYREIQSLMDLKHELETRKENGGFTEEDKQELLNFKSNSAWCLPKADITRHQKVLIFNKYVKEHPEGLHLPAIQTLTRAFGSHFPCLN